MSDFVDVFSDDVDQNTEDAAADPGAGATEDAGGEHVDRRPGELSGTSDVDGDEDAAPQLYYPNPIAFFTGTLGPSYVRDVGNGSEFAWCPQWYKHPEALSRIESVWRAWEYLRMDGSLGISTWWTNHADPHMRMLMAPNGCFKKCVYNGHAERTKPEQLSLPHIEPTMDLYPDV